MGKNFTGNRPASKPGKGRLTPIQVAYLVDRYLFENNFTNTLHAFRSEASCLFSKTIDKKVPEGLLSLGNILDEYITLKEQKTNMEREKKKHSALVQGIQESLLLYASDSVVGTPLPSSTPIHLPHSSSSILVPNPSPLSHHFSLQPPPGMLMPLPTPSPISKSPGDFADAFATSSSPQGYTIQRTSLDKSVVSIPPNDVESPKSSEPNTLPIPPPKRSRADEPSYASAIGGIMSPSPVNNIRSIPCSSIQNDQSSPKTPSPLSFSSQCDNSVIPSKKVFLISPPHKKKTGSYSGERSPHHVSISSLKSCSNKLVKRDNVKNKLDFECLEGASSIEIPISTSDNHEEKEYASDLDFLTICADVSFSSTT